jgi:hypothetical protein
MDSPLSLTPEEAKIVAGMERSEKDPITESMPKDWLPEQKLIAKDAMAVLRRHYPSYVWGIEWQEPVGGVMGPLIIRIRDVPTDVVYMIDYKDIDRDRMHCVVVAGGMLLESHGLSRTKGRGDEVRGLKRTAAGLIIPDYAAIPETNPGYVKVKALTDTLR